MNGMGKLDFAVGSLSGEIPWWVLPVAAAAGFLAVFVIILIGRRQQRQIWRDDMDELEEFRDRCLRITSNGELEVAKFLRLEFYDFRSQDGGRNWFVYDQMGLLLGDSEEICPGLLERRARLLALDDWFREITGVQQGWTSLKEGLIGHGFAFILQDDLPEKLRTIAEAPLNKADLEVSPSRPDTRRLGEANEIGASDDSSG